MKFKYKFCIISWLVLSLFQANILLNAKKQKLILSSTTSPLDSGLFDVLIPIFEKKYNCSVKVIAVGTGQAIRLAKDGNADVILVHDKAEEEKFVRDGYGVKRLNVMHNDFFIVGPKNDPAKIKPATKDYERKMENRNQELESKKNKSRAVEAFKKIYNSKSPFVSRGDDSGTHKVELKIWKQARIRPDGDWYIESGTGMEATLRIANEKKAYCLVDRAIWLAHKGELDSLEKFVEGDSFLLNSYSVIAVSPKKYPHVNYKLAMKFIEFIRGYEGQKIIKEFGVDKFGEPLYFPDVTK